MAAAQGTQRSEECQHVAEQVREPLRRVTPQLVLQCVLLVQERVPPRMGIRACKTAIAVGHASRRQQGPARKTSRRWSG